MRDANKIAMRAVRKILGGARPVELNVAGRTVACSPPLMPSPGWRSSPVEGLDEQGDGPWPSPVEVACKWAEGSCTLIAKCSYVRAKNRYRHHVALELQLRDGGQVVWINVASR